jgi:HlyD family secretion protein
MNVDAKIEVAKQENTLMVPLEALQKRGDTYMVWVKREGAAQGAIGEPRGNNDGGNTDAAEQPGDENRAGQTSGDRNSQGFGNMTDEQRSELRQRMQEQMGDEGEAIQGRTGDASTYTGRAASDIREETSGIQSVVSSGNYYEGAVLVPVETGIYNESYMEITGGLNEGETVVLPQQVSNTATGTSQGNMPFGMDLPIGGFGGVSNNPAQGVRMR